MCPFSLGPSKCQRQALDPIQGYCCSRKALLGNEINESSIIDGILEGQDTERKMCRKCFTAFQTCAGHHVILETNLRKAADSLGLICTSSQSSEMPALKRPQLSMSGHVSALNLPPTHLKLLFYSNEVQTFTLLLNRLMLGTLNQESSPTQVFV